MPKHLLPELIGFEKHIEKLREALALVQSFDSTELGSEIGHSTTLAGEAVEVHLPGARFEIVQAIFRVPDNGWRFGQLTYRALVESPGGKVLHEPFRTYFVDHHGNVGEKPNLSGFATVGDYDWHIRALRHVPLLRIQRAERLRSVQA